MLYKLYFPYFSREAIAEAIVGHLLVFLQFKEFELYRGTVFYSQIFMIFGVNSE